MSRQPFVRSVSALAVALAGAALWHTTRAQEPASKGPADTPAQAAVRKTAAEFAAAFNRGDAKAVAALWTAEGEFTGADGVPVRGRQAIEKAYADFFKDTPGARVAVDIQSLRLLGPYTALEEGTLKLERPGAEPAASRYSVLHVRDDGGWKMASSREWPADPNEATSLQDLAWLVGTWSARAKDVEVTSTYAWDEDKAFLRGRHTVKQDGKVLTTGSQVIGRDPNGGLRSWQFENTGAFGESFWSRDGKRWLIQAAGTLPDGSPTAATNILIPLGPDAFTWQSVDRSAADARLPDLPPVRVTRVKTGG